MKNWLASLFAFFALVSLAAAQTSTVTVNSATGAITGPVSATTFKSINSIQPLDSDLTSWAAITRGTGFDTAAALNVGSAGAFVTFNGAGGTPTSMVGTNITGTAAGLTAGNVTTNANLTGDVTSSGNVATVANVPANATHGTDLTSVPTDTGGWTKYFVTGSNYQTSTTTAGTDITGLTSGTLSTSTRYEFEVTLNLLNAADTTGMKFAYHIAGTGSPTVVSVIWGNQNSATSAAVASLNALDTLNGNGLVAFSGGTGVIRAVGFFVTGTGTPTFSVQLAKVTSNTATCIVGSNMRIRKADQ